jgi:excisionase family DNA binding protein
MSPLLTTEEVAGILRVSSRTVQRLVNARRIPVVIGCGKHWKFRPESIEQFVKDTETLALKPTRPHRHNSR